MAITVSLLGTPTFTTASGTKTVTATPAVGDLIVIITAHTGNTSTAAPTDNNAGGGGTYTIVNTAVKATSADTMKVWVRDNLITSATSTVFTHAPGTSSGGGLVVIDCQGGDKAGLSAIVQSAIQSNQAANGTPAPVFASAVASDNAVIGAVFNASNPAALTPRTNFGELFDSGYNNPTTGLEVMSDNSGETGTTMTWGSTSASAYASLVVEIEASITHATTGTLTGQIGSVSGSAKLNKPHTTSGTLTGQIGSVSGSASRFRTFSTSGTLSGQLGSISGSARLNIPHPTSGTLTGQDSSIVGSATRFRAFSTSGTLSGQGSIVTGNANRQSGSVTHVTDGTLVGQGSTVNGSSTRFRAYNTSGTLTGQGSSIVGDANRFRQFSTSGNLDGQVASITGNARHNIPHLTSGALTGQGSSIVGDAEHTSSKHDATGDLVAQGAIIAGKASQLFINVTGSTSIRPKPSIIVVEVDGKEYRVPALQLQSFLDAIQQKVEDTTPVKKKRKKQRKQTVEVVEVKELPQIVIKSAPVSIIPQIQNRVDEVNTIIANSFSKALQQYVQNIELENVKIELAKKQAIQDEEEWLLMIL
jgi:hypothetical protein